MTDTEKMFSTIQWPDSVSIKLVCEALHSFCTDFQWGIQRTDRKQITCPTLLLTKVMSNNIKDLKWLYTLFSSPLGES